MLSTVLFEIICFYLYLFATYFKLIISNQQGGHIWVF